MREDARVLKNWRKINCWAQIITRRSRFGFWWFVLNNWFFFNFLTPAHPHAQSLFLFPIVFGINFFSVDSSVRSVMLMFILHHVKIWKIFTIWMSHCNSQEVLYYSKRGNTSYIVRAVRSVREREREREREKERERETDRQAEVTPPLSRWNWRWVNTFPCQKFALSFLPSHFPSPFLNGHRFGAEIRNEFTLSAAKKFTLSFQHSQMPRVARRSIEDPRQN